MDTRPARIRQLVSANRGTTTWILLLAVAFLAGQWWRGPQSGNQAFAQAPPLAGARGVYAFSGPIAPNRYGLFMLDIEQGTIWCYELNYDRADVPRLRLVAGRSWIYDRYLRNFNCAAPDFRTVQELVEQERLNLLDPAAPAAGPDDLERETAEFPPE